MAKVTVTIEDTEDGQIGIETQIDPPARPNDQMTPAMSFAFKMIELASDHFGAEASE